MTTAEVLTAVGTACLLQAALILWAFGLPGGALHKGAFKDGYDQCGRVMDRFQTAALGLAAVGLIAVMTGVLTW